jgi:hypothetical protein
MKIMVTCCVRDAVDKTVFTPATITTYVGDESAPFPMEYFTESTCDFHPSGQAHHSCSHAPTVCIWADDGTLYRSDPTSFTETPVEV